MEYVIRPKRVPATNKIRYYMLVAPVKPVELGDIAARQGGVMSYVTLPTATTTYAGLMSPGQAKKLSDLASRVAALEAAVGIS